MSFTDRIRDSFRTGGTIDSNDNNRAVVVSGPVLSSRLMAYLVDFVIIAFLGSILWVALWIFGFLTFGLTWFALAIVFPMTALLYNAITISGSGMGTPGMRFAGLKVTKISGERVDFFTAGVHALFFYVTVTALTPFVLLFGLLNAERRLLHDYLTGIIVSRG